MEGENNQRLNINLPRAERDWGGWEETCCLWAPAVPPRSVGPGRGPSMAPEGVLAAPGSAEGQHWSWRCCSIPLSCPIPGQGAVGSLEVQKESPPDQFRISLYYLNPLCTTTKNKKTLLNSLRYENYKLCTSTAVSARVEDHGLWWLNLRPRTAGTPSPSSLHRSEHRATRCHGAGQGRR